MLNKLKEREQYELEGEEVTFSAFSDSGTFKQSRPDVVDKQQAWHLGLSWFDHEQTCLCHLTCPVLFSVVIR